MSVIAKPRQWGRPGSLEAVAPSKNKKKLYFFLEIQSIPVQTICRHYKEEFFSDCSAPARSSQHFLYVYICLYVSISACFKTFILNFLSLVHTRWSCLPDSYDEVKQDEWTNFYLWRDTSDRQFGFWHCLQHFNGSSRNAGLFIEFKYTLASVRIFCSDFSLMMMYGVWYSVQMQITSILTLHKYYTRAWIS